MVAIAVDPEIRYDAALRFGSLSLLRKFLFYPKKKKPQKNLRKNLKYYNLLENNVFFPTRMHFKAKYQSP